MIKIKGIKKIVSGLLDNVSNSTYKAKLSTHLKKNNIVIVPEKHEIRFDKKYLLENKEEINKIVKTAYFLALDNDSGKILYMSI